MQMSCKYTETTELQPTNRFPPRLNVQIRKILQSKYIKSNSQYGNNIKNKPAKLYVIRTYFGSFPTCPVIPVIRARFLLSFSMMCQRNISTCHNGNDQIICSARPHGAINTLFCRVWDPVQAKTTPKKSWIIPAFPISNHCFQWNYGEKDNTAYDSQSEWHAGSCVTRIKLT